MRETASSVGSVFSFSLRDADLADPLSEFLLSLWIHSQDPELKWDADGNRLPLRNLSSLSSVLEQYATVAYENYCFKE